jgi:formylglycine-generating enzyme required for sulfatase activity
VRHAPAAVVVALFLGSFALPAREADGRVGCPAGTSLIVPPEKDDGTALPPFCIDRFEGALVELSPDGERPFSPYETVKGRNVRAVSRAGAVPQAYISRNEADAACHASHKRLCTEEEWVTACRGKRPTAFPYGDTRHPGYCNDSGTAPLPIVFANLGSEMYYPEPMNDPRLNQIPNTVAPAGSHPHCKNSWGVYDMVGNVHEWVDDPAGTFRGGYFLDTHINGDGCAYRTIAHDATYHDYSTGFRCCADPK